MKLKIFDRETVRRCLTMPRTIELMEHAFVALSAGTIESPLRTTLSNPKGTVLYKPAYSESEHLFSIKIVSVFPENSRLGLPVTPGLLVINDADTGIPTAIMDAGYLTSLRTGAATGLATRILADPKARTAALFGTGGQAIHQLEAMLAVRELRQIYVFSRLHENAISFCDEVGHRFPSCTLRPSCDKKVLAECQIVTTATTSHDALFKDADLPAQVHINAIGSLGIHKSEIAVETMKRAVIVVDQRDACESEAGELQALLVNGRLPDSIPIVELGTLVGSETSQRQSGASVFKSVGNAAQDIICASEVIRCATEMGLGTSTEL